MSKHAIRPGTLEAIVEAAITVLGANPAASMSEIAIQAGVGRATLHRHFPNREELINLLQHRCLEETNRAVADRVSADQPSLARLENAMCAIIPLGDRYSFLSGEYAEDEALVAAYRAQLEWVKTLVTDLKADGHMATDVPDAWALAQIDQLIWTAWDQVSRGHLDAEQAPALAVRTLLRGLS